jgi:Uri superfamily endonuclease
MDRDICQRYFAVAEKRSVMPENSKVKSYQLQILVSKPVMIAIGKLGLFEFPAGEYIYTGSGKRHIEARVSRHLSRSRNLNWHIDYLLSNSAARITGVAFSDEPECAVNQKTLGEILVPRFGAMDCRNGCGSHLKYLGGKKATEKGL